MAAIKNRRRGPDTMVKMITIFSVVSWIIIITVLVLFTMSNPSAGSNMLKRAAIAGGSTVMLGAKLLLFINVMLCVWGMAVNMMRNKRRSDRFHLSLIVSLIVSLGAFILMMTMM